uniref:Retrovirus-related Pol polyprotein from transposon 17.6 n=1 Tax=Zeugodacus cucurbitae TaxID=28588 RepID=A0A0A1XLE4_ZEUCU
MANHPISYASRTLNTHEKNYSTIEKELLTIVWAVKYYRPYLYGREFDLKTDHQPLKWLQKKNSGKDINPRLQRWLIQLGEYDAKIDYITGKENKIADFLSRINSDEINMVNSENLGMTLYKMLQIKDLNAGEQQDQTMLSIEVQTSHSHEENVYNHFNTLNTVVNRFKQQLILVEVKEKEVENIFKTKRIFIDIRDINSHNIINIVDKYFEKGKIAIYSELNRKEHNEIEQILLNAYTNHQNMSFVNCTNFAKDIGDEYELKKQISFFHKIEVGHSGIIPTYEGMKHKVYHPQLKIKIHEIINNCDICSGGKYDRNPIKAKLQFTETPNTVNEIGHIDIYVNSKQSFIIFIDKFSKHVISFHLPDRNSQTIIEKINEFLSIKGHIKKFVFDNEFNSKPIREFLNKEHIEFHATKSHSHTGNSDVERINNTLTERIRTLNLEEKASIIIQMCKAVKLYNNSFHTTIKATPLDVQNNKIEHSIIKNRLEEAKLKIISNHNTRKENYLETRREGFIRNYKSVRHKEEPKFIKRNLENVHTSNIKRPLKFANDNNDTRNTNDN